jgi:SAM-dependent methyltransferase
MQAQERYARAYGAGADAYARVLDPTLAPILRRLVELTELRPGCRVLDLATGTGAVARIAAEAGADVVGVDISPGMIDAARSLSPDNVRFEVADVTRLPFGARSFSAVTCGFGLSHFPDAGAALAEALRVLDGGGVFVECSWGSEGSSPAFSAALELLRDASGDELHAFSGILDEATWADTDRGADALRQAGFGSVAAFSESFAGTYADADDAVAWTLAWPDYGETFAKLDAAVQASFIAEARRAIVEFGDLSWRFAINFYVGHCA